MRKIQVAVCVVVGLLVGLLATCSQVRRDGGASGEASGVVVLDIGHYLGGEGAASPSAVGGQVLRECRFWHRYAPVVKQEVERAGYRCVITNRGNPPQTEPLLTEAKRAGIIYLRHPDKGGARYPSHYFPDRVASGMVSADYAIYRRAACVVFLHHNSSGNHWMSGASPSVVLCNKYNGRALAESMRRTLESEVLNHGMPNGGKGCRIEVRSVDAERAAGWLNACDDAGIPAIVTEAAFLNNRGHAEYLAQEAGARAYATAVGRAIVRYMANSAGEQRHYRRDPNTPDEGSFGYAQESRRLNVPGARRLPF